MIISGGANNPCIRKAARGRAYRDAYPAMNLNTLRSARVRRISWVRRVGRRANGYRSGLLETPFAAGHLRVFLGANYNSLAGLRERLFQTTTSSAAVAKAARSWMKAKRASGLLPITRSTESDVPSRSSARTTT